VAETPLRRIFNSIEGQAITSPTPQTYEAMGQLPIAGPNVKPQTLEIDVAPWQRISVQFKAVHADVPPETGQF